jgi:hypothetical protein
MMRVGFGAWRAGGLVLASVAIALAAAGASSAVASTYVANCANTYYLDLAPEYWSNGCTGGALNLEHLHWARYGTHGAKARGRAALRRPCGTHPTCPEAGVYRAAARLAMWRPRPCTSGPAAGERFFSRVRARVRYRRGNPFGQRPGWKTYRFHIRAYEGHCEYSP